MSPNRKCWCVCSDIKGLFAFPISILEIINVVYCTIWLVIYPIYGYSFPGVALMGLFLFFAVMVVWSGFKASFTEPGMVVNTRPISEEERDFYLYEESYNYCVKCNTLKPLRAHHCSKCGICILKMDHHCPWINNCVGARNQKYFILFLIYVHMGEVLATLLGGWQIWNKRFLIKYYTEFVYLRHISPLNQYLPNWMLDHLVIPIFRSYAIPYVFLLFEVFLSMLFGVFAFIMLYDQIRSIRYDLTFVEYLKQYHIKTDENTFYDSLVSTMGEPPCWRWFFPIEGKYLNAILCKLSNEFICSYNNEMSSDEDEFEKKNQ